MAPLCDLSGINIDEDKSYTIRWTDQAGVRPLEEENRDEDDLVNLNNPAPIMNHRQFRQTKSNIKGTRAQL